MPALRQRKQMLRMELQAIADQTNDRAAFLRLVETLTAFLARLRSAAETLNVAERQRIVRLLVKDVLVGQDTITIRHSIPIPSGPSQNGGSQPEGPNYLLCKGRGTTALRRSFFHTCPFPILQHARVEPFLDQSHDAPICYPVLDEFHQPFVGKPIEKVADIQIEHPVHLSRQQSRIERVQRLVLASPGPEPIGEFEKIRFVDSVQHFDRRALNDLVFQHGHSERSFPPVALVDVRPTHRLGSIRSSLQSMGEILEIVLEGLAVVPPRLSIDPGRGFLLQAEVGPAQRVRVVDVVQKRREPQLLILTCSLTYPLQRTERVFPARCPGRVLLGQVPFGQTSSLHPLRCRLSGVVRGLPRYSRSVRLPWFVRHRRTSLDFPMRPEAIVLRG